MSFIKDGLTLEKDVIALIVVFADLIVGFIFFFSLIFLEVF
jgi:hypothetical protein